MNEEELDQQIRAALEVHPSSEQLVRMESFWNQQNPGSDSSRRRWQLVAVAASTILALCLLTWLSTTRPRPTPEDTPLALRSNPTTADASTPSTTDHPTLENRRLNVGRPPTAYEQLIFIGSRTHSTDSSASRWTAVIDQLLESIQQDPATDVEELAASAGLVGPAAEAALLGRLKRPSGDDREVLLRLLTVCGSSRSIPMILALGRQGSLRDQAVLAVDRIAGTAGLADAARAANDPELRRGLYSGCSPRTTKRRCVSFWHCSSMRPAVAMR